MNVSIDLDQAESNIMTGALLAFVSKQAVLWTTLALLGLVGLIAVISPNRFQKLATRSGQWVDTNKLAEVLDRRVDIDRYVLPFSRLLGVAVILSVAVLSYVVFRYQ
jgi:hypothetical protein